MYMLLFSSLALIPVLVRCMVSIVKMSRLLAGQARAPGDLISDSEKCVGGSPGLILSDDLYRRCVTLRNEDIRSRHVFSQYQCKEDILVSFAHNIT